MRRIVPFVFATWLLLPVDVAWSVDGVLEINQTCAVNTGCFPGDTAGFPVDVTTQGSSVRLTGSLTVPDANTTAIVIDTTDVTVDLNGFALIGPTSCTGLPLTCTNTGTGTGIEVRNAYVTILNGTVHGMGSYGINQPLGWAVTVQGVRAISNGGNGIEVSSSASVYRCVAFANGDDGIFIGGSANVVRESKSSRNAGRGIFIFRGSIIGNNVADNGGHGIEQQDRGIVSDNLSRSNGGHGIDGGVGGTISNNSAWGNGQDGINAGTSTVIGNSASQNTGNGIRGGNTIVNNETFGNDQAGISCAGCTVLGNTTTGNGGYGITNGGFAGSIGYGNNTIDGNTTGTVVGGTEIGTNICNGSTTCP